MGARLMAIVAEGARGRVYLAPTDEHGSHRAQALSQTWKPDGDVHAANALGLASAIRTDSMGRSLHPAATGGADDVLRSWCRKRSNECRKDAVAAGMADDGRGLDAGGTGATAYAEAVGVYLAFAREQDC